MREISLLESWVEDESLSFKDELAHGSFIGQADCCLKKCCKKYKKKGKKMCKSCPKR